MSIDSEFGNSHGLSANCIYLTVVNGDQWHDNLFMVQIKLRTFNISLKLMMPLMFHVFKVYIQVK